MAEPQNNVSRTDMLIAKHVRAALRANTFDPLAITAAAAAITSSVLKNSLLQRIQVQGEPQ